MQVRLLIIKFQQAIDNTKKGELMPELGVSTKLKRLIKTIRVTIKIRRGETDEFEINKGVS